ncbi:MAG: hypothetical protein IJE25_05370 [Clostridia bacterium]|nr:hypothetical protein [Clostridia bacterium]
MKNYDYGYGFKPISSWGYVGYKLLWSIPVVGWIIWLVQAIGSKNRNVRNYARSFVCAAIIGIAFTAVVTGVAFLLNALGIVTFEAVMDYFRGILSYAQEILQPV